MNLKRWLPALIVLAAASTYPLAKWISTPGQCRDYVESSNYIHGHETKCAHPDQVMRVAHFTGGGGHIFCTCPHK
jgi:hypothetical protein